MKVERVGGDTMCKAAKDGQAVGTIGRLRASNSDLMQTAVRRVLLMLHIEKLRHTGTFPVAQ